MDTDENDTTTKTLGPRGITPPPQNLHFRHHHHHGRVIGGGSEVVFDGTCAVEGDIEKRDGEKGGRGGGGR